ncbi:hypothetical protein RUND412_007536 [Rhizina undulata]
MTPLQPFCSPSSSVEPEDSAPVVPQTAGTHNRRPASSRRDSSAVRLQKIPVSRKRHYVQMLETLDFESFAGESARLGFVPRTLSSEK